jgi:hypothetical protein
LPRSVSVVVVAFVVVALPVPLGVTRAPLTTRVRSSQLRRHASQYSSSSALIFASSAFVHSVTLPSRALRQSAKIALRS